MSKADNVIETLYESDTSQFVQGCADKSVQLFPRSSGKAIAKGKEDNGMKV